MKPPSLQEVTPAPPDTLALLPLLLALVSAFAHGAGMGAPVEAKESTASMSAIDTPPSGVALGLDPGPKLG